MTPTVSQQSAIGSSNPPTTTARVAFALLLLLALTWFAVRGPYRGLTGSADLRLIYAQSLAWLQGRNPYNHQDLTAALASHGVDVAGGMSRDYWPAIYPPTMHPLMAPLAMMPWPAARATWVALNILLVAALITLLWRWAAWPSGDWRGRWLVLLTLLFWPLHTGFNTGQLTLISLTLGLAAGALDRRGRPIVAGLLLGLGIALKPQVAGVVWLCLLFEGRWRSCLWSFLVPLLAGALGVTVLYLNDVPWLADLRRNLADNAVSGGGDPTSVNPLRYQLLNLHWPLHEFLASRRLVSALVMGAALVVTLASAIAARRRRDASTSLLLLATLTTLSMLVVYRRMYDAVLLLPAVAAVLAGFGRWPRWASWLAMVVILAYLTPGSVMWVTIADKAHLSASIVDAWWWRGVVLPSQVWLTLLLTMLLLARLCRPSEAIADQADNSR